MARWDGSWLLLHPQPTSEEAITKAAEFLELNRNDPGLMVVTDEGSLKIEHVRGLQQEVSVTPAGGKGRVVVITPGERITPPAQQALLKLLEEPPEHTTFAIVARSSSSVLATIQSRCRVQELVPSEKGRAETLEKIAAAKTLKQAVGISQGLPNKREELLTLLSEELRVLSLEKASAEHVAVAEKALEVIQALGNNVSPALCAEELCFFRFRSRV